jgi:hypothetical protein
VILQTEHSARVFGVSLTHRIQYAVGGHLTQGRAVPSTANLFRYRLKATVPKV